MIDGEFTKAPRGRSIITIISVSLALVGTASAQTALTQQPVGGTFTCEVAVPLDGGTLALSCEKVPDDDSEPPAAHYSITNVRRYLSSIHEADWLYYTFQAKVAASGFRNAYQVRTRFQQGTGFSDCTDYFYDVSVGEFEDELSIPENCGADVQWSTVTIQPADSSVCEGCGSFARTALPTSRSLDAGAVDPEELNSVINEIQQRVLPR